MTTLTGWERAERPSPALPLGVLALAVLGAIPFATATVTAIDPGGGTGGMYDSDASGLRSYWLIAIPLAYVVIHLVARWQGYRSGWWVDRKPLTVAGIVALAVLVTVFVIGPSLRLILPGDLTIRGFVPLLTIVVGLAIWARSERSVTLALVAAVDLAVALMVNLYNPENIGYRLDWLVPEIQVPALSLGLAAAALGIPAVGFLLVRPRRTARVG